MSVFADLVGQEAVVAQLRAAAAGAARAAGRAAASSGGGMTHAWLFTGPPGLRPLDRRRAFAAALQCDDRRAAAGTARGARRCWPARTPTSRSSSRRACRSASRTPADHPALVARPDPRPLAGHRSSRTPTGSPSDASNALLKALEEPPPHSVLLLSAPSAEDLLPTIRSRCRLARAAHPAGRGGRPGARRARRRRPGHGGLRRAGRAGPHRPGQAPGHRRGGPPRAPGRAVAAALAAGRRLGAERRRRPRRRRQGRGGAAHHRPRRRRAGVAVDRARRRRDRQGRHRRPRGSAGALKELEKTQKSRGTRTQRDALDRALVDLAAFYRDVLQLQLGTGAALVHADLRDQAATIARATTPASTLRRIDAVLACREALDANVAPLLAVEAMALALRTG